MSAATRFGYEPSGQLGAEFVPLPMTEPPTEKQVLTPAQQFGLNLPQLERIAAQAQGTTDVTQPPPRVEFTNEDERVRRCLAWMDTNAPQPNETRVAYLARMPGDCRPSLPDYERNHPRMFATTSGTASDRDAIVAECRAWATANPQRIGEASTAYYDRMMAALPQCATVFSRPSPTEITPTPPVTPTPVTTQRTAMDTVRSLAQNRTVQIGAVVAGGYVLYRLLRK